MLPILLQVARVLILCDTCLILLLFNFRDAVAGLKMKGVKVTWQSNQDPKDWLV